MVFWFKSGAPYYILLPLHPTHFKMQDSSTASDVVIGPSYDAFKKHGMYMKCYNEFLSKCYCSLHESEYLVADMIVETMAHI